MMRTGTQHEILRTVLTILLGRRHAVLSITPKTHNSLAACWLLVTKEEEELGERHMFATNPLLQLAESVRLRLL